MSELSLLVILFKHLFVVLPTFLLTSILNLLTFTSFPILFMHAEEQACYRCFENYYV